MQLVVLLHLCHYTVVTPKPASGMVTCNSPRAWWPAGWLQGLLEDAPGDQHILEQLQQVQRLAATASTPAAAGSATTPQAATARAAAARPATAPAAVAVAPVQRSKIAIEEDSGSEDEDSSTAAGSTSSRAAAKAPPATPATASTSTARTAPAPAPTPAAAPAASTPAPATAAAAATGTSSRMHQAASALAAAALASRVPKQPPPPRSAHDFEQATKTLSSHPDVLQAYILSIDPALYASIFKANLSDKSIKAIVAALRGAVAAPPAEGEGQAAPALDLAARALEELTKVQRFGTMYGLAVRQAREDVRAVVAALAAAGRATSALEGPYKL